MSPSARSSRNNQRTSPYPGLQKRQTTTPKPLKESHLPKTLISIEAFLSNLVFGLVIQDDDDIAELFFNRAFSRDLDETANGAPLDFKGFEDFISNLRADVSDRRLASESQVVMLGDPEGRTGTVAHSFQFTGTQAGEDVKGTVVAVVNVSLNEKQERKIKMESFVFRTDRV